MTILNFLFLNMQRPCLITDDDEILETRKIDAALQSYRQWTPSVLENKKPFDTFYVNTHHNKETKIEFRSRAVIIPPPKAKESLSATIRGILDKPSAVKEVIPPQTDGVVQDTRG